MRYRIYQIPALILSTHPSTTLDTSTPLDITRPVDISKFSHNEVARLATLVLGLGSFGRHCGACVRFHDRCRHIEQYELPQLDEIYEQIASFTGPINQELQKDRIKFRCFPRSTPNETPQSAKHSPIGLRRPSSSSTKPQSSDTDSLIVGMNLQKQAHGNIY
jgi:hypothetical protein